MKQLPDKSVDAVICDPPYATLLSNRPDRTNHNEWDKKLDYSTIVEQLKRITKKGTPVILFDDITNMHRTATELERTGSVIECSDDLA